MPELPEVETIVRRLQQVLPGKHISSVQVLMPKSFFGDLAAVAQSEIIRVTRRAKILQFDLHSNQSLLVHLKMTGQLIFVDGQARLCGGHPTNDWVQSLPSAHTRVFFTFQDGSQLFFNDQRMFGWIKQVAANDIQKEYKNYAPDVIDDHITSEYFFAKTQRTTRPVKVVIMDNTVMSGVGNIYACDALNLAKIDPRRPAKTLSAQEAETLLAAAKQVITLGIQLGGATIEHFRHVDGFSGNYQDAVLVYGREGKACKNCDGIIQKFSLAGRGTYWCPSCQH